MITHLSDRLSLKAVFRAFTLTHFGAKASYIYYTPLDKNELETEVGFVPRLCENSDHLLV